MSLNSNDKDGTYYPVSGHLPTQVSLMDDVVTTEASMLSATGVLAVAGVKVMEYLCILDRRGREQQLTIKSLVTKRDLGYD